MPWSVTSIVPDMYRSCRSPDRARSLTEGLHFSFVGRVPLLNPALLLVLAKSPECKASLWDLVRYLTAGLQLSSTIMLPNHLPSDSKSNCLTFRHFRIKYLFTPEWRNWQTRYVQGVVSTALVRVQISPSAPKTSFNGGLFFPQKTNCQTSRQWYNICNKGCNV